MASLEEIDEFTKLFTGNSTAHGVFIPDFEHAETGKKVEGKQAPFTKVELVDSTLYEKHLKGEQGLGIVPVRHDGTCTFAVIDVDRYDASTDDIVKAIYKHSLPLLPFRLKSGGLHLYFFLETVTEVKQVLRTMNYFRRLFSLKKDTEIFPKQTILKEGETGNWINLPYFNSDNTRQYLIDEDMQPYSLTMAIEIIKEKRINAERYKVILDDLPLSDAPPCLQSIYVLGDTHDRNKYLFSLARYYKAKEGDDFEYLIAQANNELSDPIPIAELSNTIIQSHKKKNYSYKCKEEPICSICDKSECKSRKYGIGGAEVSDISYEEFTQYGVDDPTYEWMINGKPLVFHSEADVISQTRFREQCFRELHILPFKLTDFSWTEIVNTALTNVIVKVDEEKSGLNFSASQLFKEYLAEFLTRYGAPAANRKQVLINRVYKDDEINGYVFRSKNLSHFLVHKKQFREYGLQEIGTQLKKMGGFPKIYWIDEERVNTRVWIIPVEAIKKYADPDTKDVEIDFLDEVKNDDY